MINVLIMAGGKGERFWPASREKKPKQLLNLTGGGTMIQETVRRIRELTDPGHIFIITNSLCAPAIGEQLPEIPAANIIVEPEGRNTAPCIGLAALFVDRLDPEGVMLVLPSDHVIGDEPEFRRLLAQGAEVAQKTEGIVTLGITPDRPETGYGYIAMGVSSPRYPGVFTVERFEEKPNKEKAAQFFQSGRYLWNGGIFIWKVSTIRQLIARLMPGLDRGLAVIESAIGSDTYEQTLAEEYGKFEKISVDYGIMEKAPEVYVIPSEIGWDDVGSWSALARLMPKDDQGNAAVGRYIGIDSSGNIISNPTKLVAMLGIDDLIVVETEDGILVAKKEREQEIRSILVELRKRQWTELI